MFDSDDAVPAVWISFPVTLIYHWQKNTLKYKRKVMFLFFLLLSVSEVLLSKSSWYKIHV